MEKTIMEETYLTVKQLAEIKGCTERYIRNCITKEKIEAIQIEGKVGGNAGTHYSIPLSKLDEKIQLKYKRYLKNLQKEAEKQVQKQEIQEEQESKSMEELTEKEKENAIFWRKLLGGILLQLYKFIEQKIKIIFYNINFLIISNFIPFKMCKK